MTDDLDVVAPVMAELPALERFPMRNKEGDIRPAFVEAISKAIQVADAAFLKEIVGELHEADLGDLIEALDAVERVSLIELTGADFDFSALNEVDDSVREELLEELEPATVAEGMRDLDAFFLLIIFITSSSGIKASLSTQPTESLKLILYCVLF